jgi:hypothetical protein
MSKSSASGIESGPAEIGALSASRAGSFNAVDTPSKPGESATSFALAALRFGVGVTTASLGNAGPPATPPVAGVATLSFGVGVGAVMFGACARAPFGACGAARTGSGVPIAFDARPGSGVPAALVVRPGSGVPVALPASVGRTGNGVPVALPLGRGGAALPLGRGAALKVFVAGRTGNGVAVTLPGVARSGVGVAVALASGRWAAGRGAADAGRGAADAKGEAARVDVIMRAGTATVLGSGKLGSGSIMIASSSSTESGAAGGSVTASSCSGDANTSGCAGGFTSSGSACPDDGGGSDSFVLAARGSAGSNPVRLGGVISSQSWDGSFVLAPVAAPWSMWICALQFRHVITTP